MNEHNHKREEDELCRSDTSVRQSCKILERPVSRVCSSRLMPECWEHVRSISQRCDCGACPGVFSLSVVCAISRVQVHIHSRTLPLAGRPGLMSHTFDPVSLDASCAFCFVDSVSLAFCRHVKLLLYPCPRFLRLSAYREPAKVSVNLERPCTY